MKSTSSPAKPTLETGTTLQNESDENSQNHINHDRQLRGRSPHPYQYGVQTLNHFAQDGKNSFPSNSDAGKPGSHRTAKPMIDGGKDDSNESGTEADDEGFRSGYGFKALPPPSLRSRKGLKDGSSPETGYEDLATSKNVEEHMIQINRDAILALARLAEGQAGALDADTKPKAAARKRGEILRRIGEFSLVACLGIMVINQPSVWLIAQQWRFELAVHLSVVFGIYAVYPFRLLLYSWRRGTQRSLFDFGLRIRASFDPAELIYPVALPVLVCFSIAPDYIQPLLANLILSLAAVPRFMVPLSRSPSGYMVHWFLSTLPLLMYSEGSPHGRLTSQPNELQQAQYGDRETLILLSPLHQTLLIPLHQLTATSLLPSELQLLSIGLINLLFFAQSPQALILSTLLWTGGLGVQIFLRNAISSGILLARIPIWRFRKTNRKVQYRQMVFDILRSSLGRKRTPVAPKGTTAAIQSDADDSDDDRSLASGTRVSQMETLTTDIFNSLRSSFFVHEDTGTKSAVEVDPAPRMNGHSRRRRYTMPASEDTKKLLSSSPILIKRARRLVKTLFPPSLLHLTADQARLRKWVYASYVYTGIVILIIGPIRMIISRLALDSYEPIGWALGYLLGNIQPFRFSVFDWNPGAWIAVPPLSDFNSTTMSAWGRADRLRLAEFGAANTRLLICAYFLCILAIGLAAVTLLTIVEVDTRRKVFHGMMVAMLLPTIFIDPAFISLALGLILAIFLILDLIRASQLPPLSKPIALFLTPYVDGRDLRGPVVISHIFLLIGCAIPLWLDLASQSLAGEEPWRGWEVQGRNISMVSGVICVGMGDAAASLIGRRYGRRKWPWSGGKSLEGSAAFAMAVTVGLCMAKAWLYAGQWKSNHGDAQRDFMELILSDGVSTIAKAGIAACMASFTEAVLTGGNDNVFVPIVLWLLVRVLDI